MRMRQRDRRNALGLLLVTVWCVAAVTIIPLLLPPETTAEIHYQLTGDETPLKIIRAQADLERLQAEEQKSYERCKQAIEAMLEVTRKESQTNKGIADDMKKARPELFKDQAPLPAAPLPGTPQES